jgi:hypothetical protein
MTKFAIGVIALLIVFFGLTFLSSCSSTPPTLIYEGVLENISTIKNTTTITFADGKIASTNDFDYNLGDAVFVYGLNYNLMRVQNGGEILVYLTKVQ